MRKKEDKTRKNLGNPGDIVKVSGIVQHLGKIGDKQTICLATVRVNNNGKIEYTGHTWIQNPTKTKLDSDFIGQVIRIEGILHSYKKYNRTMKTYEDRLGITMIKKVDKFKFKN